MPQFELAFEPSPTSLEDTESTAVGSVNLIGLLRDKSPSAEDSHPEIGSGNGKKKPTKTLRILKARLVKAKAILLTISEERLGGKANFIGVPRRMLPSIREMVNQDERDIMTIFPTSITTDRAIEVFFCEQNIGDSLFADSILL